MDTQASVPAFSLSAGALQPVQTPALLGLLSAVLDSGLIERGAVRGMELLGSSDTFWRALALDELLRMANAGNTQAQAELAWRQAAGVGGAERSTAQALRWAGASAEAGCAAGQAVLGWLLYYGLGLPRDEVEAARLFERAAMQQDLRGLTWLALCLLRGQGVSLNERRALALLKQAASQAAVGARLAQYWLGRIYYFGLTGVCPQDYATAVIWLKKAAEHDHPGARELLARCLFFGRGAAIDRVMARTHWQRAAEAGNVAASYGFGLCLYAGEGGEQNYPQAAHWLQMAADRGLSAAMFLLGQCHVFGRGLKLDLLAGLSWYRRAAEKGNREAEFELAEWHAFGRAGLAVDMVEAIRWYRRAARRGHPQAQRKLGHCYRNGDGLTENKAQALAWYQRAAAGQDVLAQIWLGECHEQGDGVAINPVQAVQYYRAAAAQHSSHGMAELGRCLLYGIGVEADPVGGEALLREAAQLGWLSASNELGRYFFARAEKTLQAWQVAAADNTDGTAFPRALADYQSAAELGHARAAYILGACHQHGYGVACHFDQAVYWYQKASRLFEARLALADLYYTGLGEQHQGRDLSQARHWYAKAVALQEDAYAMYSLGYCLLYGQGTAAEPDGPTLRRACRWLKKAALLGEPAAQFELGRAYAQGLGVSLQPRLAMKWLRSSARLGYAAAQNWLAALKTEG